MNHTLQHSGVEPVRISVDTYSAIPSIRRIVLKVLDPTVELAVDEANLNSPLPTINKIFIAYERGLGCPVPIAMEVDRIFEEYQSELPTPEQRMAALEAAQSEENPDYSALNLYVRKQRRANVLLRRNLLSTVIKQLDLDDANNMLDPEGNGPGEELLFDLGWLERPEATNENENENVENEQEGEDETGELKSLMQPPPTE